MNEYSTVSTGAGSSLDQAPAAGLASSVPFEHTLPRQRWCCVQAGHREQYGVPRALEAVGALDRLVTDVWAPPQSLVARVVPGRTGRRLRDRFHGGLPPEKIVASSWRSLAWEGLATLRGLGSSERVLARNSWWASVATRAIQQALPPSTGVLFSYCYEARPVFEAAQTLGLSAVLGQIDPGPVEDAKVAEIVRRWPAYRSTFEPGAECYYANWREECRLARKIVVNSAWSRSALIQTGIESEKIAVCPLVYSPPSESIGWKKDYPREFSRVRPLRVLFLGQCILRKGIAETITAAQQLTGRPVEFTFVGNTDITALTSHFGPARIRYCPRVSRAECHAFYRDADLFIFPTHSDGFGLTQLEAQAWKLPIIATPFCAEVVEADRTGWILPEVTPEAIVAAIERVLATPAELAQFSQAIVPWSFGLPQLGARLVQLIQPSLLT